jgi:hypothetical protein
MSKIFTVSDGGLPLITEGEYKATFVEYEEKKGLAYGDALKMNFEVSEGDFQGTVLNTLVSERLSPQSRFGQTVCALTGKPLKIKQDFDLDSLIGTPCIIVVQTQQGKGSYGDFSTIIEIKELSEKDLPF